MVGLGHHLGHQAPTDPTSLRLGERRLRFHVRGVHIPDCRHAMRISILVCNSCSGLSPPEQSIFLNLILTNQRYFVITNLACDEPELIRYAALLRGTESA